MSVDPVRARRLWQVLEPIHAVTYFSPEPTSALAEAGYRGYWMGYFAQRAAPLGAVGPEVVHALFYNFGRDRVARALPSAWAFAPPEVALAARASGSGAALRRAFGDRADGADVMRAADLARRAAETAPEPGRPLYAANRALPWPEDPVDVLWHAATLLREHRGDGHVAVLLTEGVSGRDAHVLHALASGTAPAVYETARDLMADEWAARVEGLVVRGLVAEGALTPAGSALRRRVEDRTDVLAAAAYDALSPEEADELAGLLLSLSRAVVATGDIPEQTPMGLVLRAVTA